MRTLVLGGARSGKSVFAETIVGSGPVLYVATARPWPDDEDFAARIASHAARRPRSWVTDDTSDLVELLGIPHSDTLLIDDLGTWLTTATDECGVDAWEKDSPALNARINALSSAIRAYDGSDVVIVTPEVGMGVIPEHASGRVFRDRIGALNQDIAGVCDRVVFVVAGQALELKTP